ncbi:MAG: ABC transporter permease, partial [Oscillospiraceae bacterium]|nr:ABC transporter permease [Oscillospiraceae bacterium]
MFENIALALQGVWSHKLRSVLTMLGIIIGIASIITIVSTIKGTNDQIKENLIGAGSNVVTIDLKQDGYSYDMNYSNLPQGVEVLDDSVRDELEALDKVQMAAFYRSRSWAEGVFFRNTPFNGNVRGVDNTDFRVNSLSVTYGRGFLEEDFTEARKVVVLDSKTANSLFNGLNPIGQTMEMAGEPFTVIGVVTATNAKEPVINSLNDYWMYANSGSGSIYIPIICWDIVYRYDEPQAVCLKATSTDDMTEAGSAAATLLNERAVTSATITYKADNLLEQAGNLQSLSETTNTQLLWIAGISLLVGGIGVMNIMLVSVTERIKEIGLKLAIGARQRRILWQFLTEAAVLTTLGGILGVGCGIGLAFMLSKVMGT